jgi:hypothetical protein
LDEERVLNYVSKFEFTVQTTPFFVKVVYVALLQQTTLRNKFVFIFGDMYGTLGKMGIYS